MYNNLHIFHYFGWCPNFSVKVFGWYHYPKYFLQYTLTDLGCEDPGFVVSNSALWMLIAWDMVSNMLLVAFPLSILSKARLPRQIKRAASGRFSHVAIGTIICIVGTATSYAVNGLGKVVWLHFWGAIQCGMFLFTCNCLAIRSECHKTHSRYSMITVRGTPVPPESATLPSRGTWQPVSRFDSDSLDTPRN